MSAPSFALVVVVVLVVVFLTLNRTSTTPTMAEVVISAEPTGPPVAVPSPNLPSPTQHAVIPDGSVDSR